jgi:hypothetical protein
LTPKSDLKKRPSGAVIAPLLLYFLMKKSLKIGMRLFCGAGVKN